MCFFPLSLDYPYTQTIGVFEEPGVSKSPAKDAAGLQHPQRLCQTNVAQRESNC